MRFAASIAGKGHELEITQRDGRFECRLDGREVSVDVAPIGPDTLSVLLHGKSYEVRSGAGDVIVVGENCYQVLIADPRSWRSRQQSATGTSGPQKLTASMPGKVVRVLTSPGSRVHAGDGIVVIEAMKMQNEIRAPRDGTVTAILVQEGMAVNAGGAVAVLD